MLSKLKALGSQVKRGARFYHQGSSFTRPVLFANGIDRDHPSSFQVKRAEFDALLLDHARESGAAVFEEARVTDVLFERRRQAGARRRGAPQRGERATHGRPRSWSWTPRGATRSSPVTSAGAGAIPLLDRSAAFAHYDTFSRAEGPTGGDIVIVTTPDGWWWLIPFSDGSVSVGNRDAVAAVQGAARVRGAALRGVARGDAGGARPPGGLEAHDGRAGDRGLLVLDAPHLRRRLLPRGRRGLLPRPGLLDGRPPRHDVGRARRGRGRRGRSARKGG